MTLDDAQKWSQGAINTAMTIDEVSNNIDKVDVSETPKSDISDVKVEDNSGKILKVEENATDINDKNIKSEDTTGSAKKAADDVDKITKDEIETSIANVDNNVQKDIESKNIENDIEDVGNATSKFTGMKEISDVPWEEKHINKIYEDIREKGGYGDIEEISKNSGIKNTQLLKKFKDHVFYSKNVLPDSNGIEINFTPDIDIAYVWKYAQDGVKFTSEQRAWFLKLMRHEVSEARYIKRGFPFRNLENPNSKINSAHFSAPTPPRNSFPDYDARNWRWWSGIK